MYYNDIKYDSFVIIEFNCLDTFFSGVYKKSEWERIELSNTILEIACVKVKDGEITEHFSTYVAIDGYDAHDLSIEGDEHTYITAEHLIGAPSMTDVVKRVVEFTEDCVIAIRNKQSFIGENPYATLTNYAKAIGMELTNPVLSIAGLETARRIKDKLEDGQGTLFDIAQECSVERTWENVFEEYDIFGDGNDSLSRAIAFAKLFIDLIEGEEWLPF